MRNIARIVDYAMGALDTRDEMVGRSVTFAILQYAKSHVSKDMILAARRVKHLRVPKREAEEVMFVAMVDVMLAEIDQDGGKG